MTSPLRNLLIVALISVIPALLSAKEIKVDYKDLSYTVKQDSKKFSYQDDTLKKEFDLKACNKKQFEIFWAQFEVNKKDITSSNKVDSKKSITLKEDHHTTHINLDAKFGIFLKQIPNQIVAFEINEKTECKR